jgi:uncharacterized integral membrane protein
MIRIFTYLLLLFLLLGVSVFATQNQQIYSLRFLNQTSIDLPLGLILVFSAGLGAIATTIWQVRQVIKVPKSPTFNADTGYANFTNFPNSKGKVKKEIRDFDDDFDDDWD